MCYRACKGSKRSARALCGGPTFKERAGKECRSESSCEWQKRLPALEVSPAEASEKLLLVEGRVKRLDADGQESELQRDDVKRNCCELEVESADLRSKLQTARSLLPDLEILLDKRVVVGPSAESRTVAAFRAKIAALWIHVKTMNYET